MYKRCTRAICNAKPAAGPEIAVAASKAVMQVPIFAPSVNGYRSFVVKSPEPARGTARLVVVDDDCTKIVTAVPEAIPDQGPLPMAECKISLALPTITDLSSLPIKVMPANIVNIPIMIIAMGPKGSGRWDSPPFIPAMSGLVIGLRKSKSLRLRELPPTPTKDTRKPLKFSKK